MARPLRMAVLDYGPFKPDLWISIITKDLPIIEKHIQSMLQFFDPTVPGLTSQVFAMFSKRFSIWSLRDVIIRQLHNTLSNVLNVDIPQMKTLIINTLSDPMWIEDPDSIYDAHDHWLATFN